MARTTRGGVWLPVQEARLVYEQVVASVMDMAAVGQGFIEVDAAAGVSPVPLSSEGTRAFVLQFTGVLSANKTFTIPDSEAIAVFIAENVTTGGFDIIIKLAGESGPGVTVPNGESALCYHDDVNMKGLTVGAGGGGVSDHGALTGLGDDDHPQYMTSAEVETRIAQLVDSSPATLDTLNELAAALGDDANFATTTATALAGKQPLDATLTALAGLTVAADKLIYATGADAFSTADLSSFARTLLDDASAAAARTTLGLGTGDSPTFAGMTIADGPAALVTNNTSNTSLGQHAFYEAGVLQSAVQHIGSNHATASRRNDLELFNTTATGRITLWTDNTLRATFADTGLTLATGVFTGPGSGLTALNASNLGSGTVPAARLTVGAKFNATLGTMVDIVQNDNSTLTRLRALRVEAGNDNDGITDYAGAQYYHGLRVRALVSGNPDSNAKWEGVTSWMNISGLSGPTVGSVDAYAFNGEVGVSDTANTHDFFQIIGGNFVGFLKGGGGCTSLQGAALRANYYGTGTGAKKTVTARAALMWAQTLAGATGEVTTMQGGYGLATVAHAITLTDVIGLDGGVNMSAGAASGNVASIRARNFALGGTAVGKYGLLVEQQTGSPSGLLANIRAVGDVPCVFGGSLGLGLDVAPSARLHVKADSNTALTMGILDNVNTGSTAQVRLEFRRGADTGTSPSRGMVLFAYSGGSGWGDYEGRNLEFYTGLQTSGTVDLRAKIDSAGRFYSKVLNSAPTDANIFVSGVTAYLDEAGNGLKFRVKYAGGTLKTGTVALV